MKRKRGHLFNSNQLYWCLILHINIPIARREMVTQSEIMNSDMSTCLGYTC